MIVLKILLQNSLCWIEFRFELDHMMRTFCLLKVPRYGGVLLSYSGAIWTRWGNNTCHSYSDLNFLSKLNHYLIWRYYKRNRKLLNRFVIVRIVTRSQWWTLLQLAALSRVRFSENKISNLSFTAVGHPLLTLDSCSSWVWATYLPSVFIALYPALF